ncbi:MAG: hypothetical protein GY774_39195 [Planctomycetes bacterium]|nr:hypothetical protein [Planctomycetota bacterium]
MKIEFYNIETGEVLEDTETIDEYFVMNNEVYSDNGATSGAMVTIAYFDMFIKRRPDIGWRVPEQAKGW